MEQQINLYQERFHPKVSQGFGPYVWLAIGAFLILIVTAIYTHWQGAKLDDELEQVSALYQERQQEMDQLQLTLQQRGKDPALEKEVIRLKKELRRQQKTLEYFKGSGQEANKQGFSEYLEALSSIDRDEIWLEAIAIESGGKQVTLQGRTLNPKSLPVYLQDLGAFPVYTSKSFSTFILLQEEDDSNVHRFVVSSEPGVELASEEAP